MNINITPEDVDNLVKDAVMKAGLGKAIQEAISKAFSGYNNPVEIELRKYVGELVSELIREKYHDHIRDAISKHVESVVTRGLIDNTVNEAMLKMKDLSDRY